MGRGKHRSRVSLDQVVTRHPQDGVGAVAAVQPVAEVAAGDAVTEGAADHALDADEHVTRGFARRAAAQAQVDDHGARGVEVHRDVVAGAADQAVGARAAVQEVVAWPALQRVGAHAAPERVGPLQAHQRVAARVAAQRVGAAQSVEQVCTVAAGDLQGLDVAVEAHRCERGAVGEQHQEPGIGRAGCLERDGGGMAPQVVGAREVERQKIAAVTRPVRSDEALPHEPEVHDVVARARGQPRELLYALDPEARRAVGQEQVEQIAGVHHDGAGGPREAEPDDAVETVAPVDGVAEVEGAAEDVTPAAAIDRIDARPTVEGVVPRGAVDGVCAGEARDQVVARGAREQVVAAGARDGGHEEFRLVGGESHSRFKYGAADLSCKGAGRRGLHAACAGSRRRAGRATRRRGAPGGNRTHL